MSKKLNIEQAKLEFEEHSLILLENEYKNTGTKMKALCVCGNPINISLDCVRKNVKCKECGKQKIKDSKKLTFEYVFNFFKEQDCVLLSTHYDNEYQKLNYICSCGNASSICFNNFRIGKRCDHCKSVKLADFHRHEFEYVKHFFEENGCELLSTTYIDNSTPLDYVCVCGNKTKITFASFKDGSRCWECKSRNNSGENNHAWKGGITSIYHYLRDKLYPWKRDSIKNCNNKCIFTGENSSYTVHHLYGFDLILQETLKETNLDIRENVSHYTSEELKLLEDKCLEIHYRYPLGVCLRNDIHLLFHSIYGYGNNTQEQFEEFKIRYNNKEFELSL